MAGQRRSDDHHGGSRLRNGAGDVHRRIQPDQRLGREPRSDIGRAKPRKYRRPRCATLCRPRGEEALALAEAMIDDAKAVTATEALEANLIDFVVDNIDDLLESLDGFTVQMNDGPRTLDTASAATEPLEMTFIEELLLLLTNPNIAFLLLAIGVQAMLIEISSPGGWVAGFIGVVCLTLAVYGMGVLPVNWFGIIFLVTAFVLFILDIKAPTHGALTTAGVASFIVGALVLFNSPGTPAFPACVCAAGDRHGTCDRLIVLWHSHVRAARPCSVPVSAGWNPCSGKREQPRSWR
ncbi:MAG: hypothetical protein MZU91_01925 [Desulfosudis oleivorans]|nr:hypothetical protein [Desulfosudis oleivorans]